MLIPSVYGSQVQGFCFLSLYGNTSPRNTCCLFPCCPKKCRSAFNWSLLKLAKRKTSFEIKMCDSQLNRPQAKNKWGARNRERMNGREMETMCSTALCCLHGGWVPSSRLRQWKLVESGGKIHNILWPLTIPLKALGVPCVLWACVYYVCMCGWVGCVLGPIYSWIE